MALYDSTGREVMAMRWDAIADKPDRINEIAALIDPNELRYVGWNDTSNELELLLFAAVDIPYDNSGSGLTATDVQAAIDEVAAGAGAGTLFHGHVNQAGTTVGSDLPSGWTVAHPGTGRYTVTHSLGLAGQDDLHICATQEDDVNFGHFIYVLPSTNSFELNFRNVSNIAQDNAWFFVAIQGPN